MGYEVKDFNNDVIEQSKTIPVLVDFWAEWCGPCRILGPTLEKLADKYEDRFKLVKLDTDHNQEIAARYGIRGIPNVKLFINGEVADEFTGALPESAVEQWLKKVIPGKNAQDIEIVKEMLNKGENGSASLMLKDLLKKDPQNSELKILLAKTLLFEDPEKAESLAIESELDVDNSDLVDSIKTIVHLFSLNGINGNDAASVYKSAIEELKRRNFDTALEKFIAVIKTDRSLDDDGARKACIAIFKFLGEDNEITLKHRRDFGSALYI